MSHLYLANGPFGMGTGGVKFGSGHVLGYVIRSVRFELGELSFGLTSGQPIFDSIRLSCKNNNSVENFGSGMVRFGSIRVSDPLSGEPISDVR